MNEQSKREKFERLGTARTKKVIKAIRILAGMGGRNRYNYEFGVEDVEKIAATLDGEVAQLRQKMSPPGRQLDIEFDLCLPGHREARGEASASPGPGTPAKAPNASDGPASGLAA